MTPEKLTNIESSFAMEDLPFDEECRDRIKKILKGTLSVQEAIVELNKKYKYNIKKENSFYCYSPVLLKRTVLFVKINQGGTIMPGMKGIYRINPALLGGIIGIAICLILDSLHVFP